MSTGGTQNVLFVVLDTVRKDHLTVYGHDRPTTPNLDAFAEEARVYEEAVAQGPWTVPSHGSMFTGTYPSEHGATQENPYLEGQQTLAQSLAAAGYDTACYTSNAWITPYTHLSDGFERQDNFFKLLPGDFFSGPLARGWKALNDYDVLRKAVAGLINVGNYFHKYFESEGGDSKTPRAIERTKSFIDEADDPFFSFVNLMDGHLPYHPPEAYREEFAPDVDPAAVCQDTKLYNAGAYEIDDEEWADIRSLYDAEIAYMDHQIGQLFEWLKETGRWEETMVVVCADHGELFGEHDIYSHEFALYEPLINVPLLVKHPDVDPGRDEETQVELLDLYHTILDATGVDPLGTNLEPTRSLLSAEYREFTDGEFAFAEYHFPVIEYRNLQTKASSAGVEIPENSRFDSRIRAGRRPDAKYIRNECIPDEAYRIDEDPSEERDVIEGDDPAIEALEAALSRFEAGVGGEWTDVEADDVLEDVGEEAREQLDALGYVE
ncbi:sulfatase [Halorhabdus sp. CBA1104]|uniref:sulfatase n=1 Tax=Halorhabdus sp. CBA1104 TaxID=1380432 RepID=UPI0012B18BB9|nr:sulfatase [Halorhabdus sp. CBA1104]QGN06532.1 sulfatase [Halorhabdus sp. CBA1104]